MTDARRCPGNRLSRRELLRVGGLGTLGLTLPQLFASRARAASIEGAPATEFVSAPGMGKARSCIMLFMMGGPAHQDTWDLKPEAPAEVRGPFQSIPTNTPGLRICEHMPRLARVSDKYAVIRSVTHGDNNHSTSGYAMMTGRPAPRSLEGALPASTDYPHMGSVVAKYLPARNPLPPYIAMPARAYNDGGITWPGQGGGFLGKKYDPFQIETELTQPTFTVDALTMPKDMGAKRFDLRRRLLDEMNRTWLPAKGPASDPQIGASFDRAFSLLAAPEVRKAFELGGEPEKLRKAYLPNNFGQACLLARRLVEAGVPLISVYWNRAVPQVPHWDTHSNNFGALKDWLLPSAEGAVATLLEDLSARGLLDSTLVMWTSEFGRTPKINGAAGRDHYGRCNSIMMAGAGVRGGQVIGASDRMAASPADNPISPADLCATVYHSLGLDPRTEMYDSFNRPLPIAEGRVIRELF